MSTEPDNQKLGVRAVISNIRLVPSLRLSVIRKVFSLMGQRERLGFIALIMAALISFIYSANALYTGLTVEVPALGGTYREGMVGQPRYINPILANSDTDQSLVKLVFSGLYRLNESGEVVPDIAESMPEIGEEGRLYKVKMKKALWHDGSPVTADDVVFTVQTLQNEEYNSPKRGDWLATSVEKLDDQTVLFKVSNASAPFLYNLTLPLISKAVWEKVPPSDFLLSQRNIEAIGNGPYVVKEVRKQEQGRIQTIILESFADYHNTRANIETLKLNFYDNSDAVLNAIHGKQIDGYGFSPFEHNIKLGESSKELTAHSFMLPQYQAVFFNTQKKIFGDAKIRRALVLGTDAQSIIDLIYLGHGRLLNSPILPEQVEGIPPAVNQFNVDAANALLDEAGWKIDSQTGIRTKNGNQLAFTLATNDFPLNAKTAELLVTQWQRLNIKVTLNILSTRELTDTQIRPRAFDALLFAQKLGADPDPFIFWHSSQTKNPGLNLSGYANNTADKLISEGRTAGNKAERDEQYRKFREIIMADNPAIFIAQNEYSYASKQALKGVEFKKLGDASTRFYLLPNWYLKTKRILK